MNDAIIDQSQLAPAESSGQPDPRKVRVFIEQLQAEQNLSMGCLGGLVAALVAAAVWAAISAATGYQIGWMAIGVGYVVGMAVRICGRGLATIFGWLGALFALAGCLLGNILIVPLLIARQEGLPLLDVLGLFVVMPSLVGMALEATFSPLDLVFYGLALLAGYRGSFRQISEAEAAHLTT